MNENFDPVINDPLIHDKEYPATMMPVCFNSAGKKLLGTILLAAGKGPHPTVLLLHGFPGNELNLDIAHAVRRAGFNVALFHYRGSWGSEGSFTWLNCIDDTKTAIELLRSKEAASMFRVDSDRIVLIGHSLGGFLTFYSLIHDEKLKAGAFMSGFNFGIWAQLIKHDDSAKKISLEQMEFPAKMLNGTSAPALLDEMLDNEKEFNLVNHADVLAKKDVFMIGAKYDQVAVTDFHHAPLEAAIRNFNPELKSKILSAGHSFAEKRIELTREIVNWLNKIEF